MPGRLSHIDLIIKDEATATHNSTKTAGWCVWKRRIPTGHRQTDDGRFYGQFNRLSLIALLVGIFLIYNTVTFNVVQRRFHIVAFG